MRPGRLRRRRRCGIRVALLQRTTMLRRRSSLRVYSRIMCRYVFQCSSAFVVQQGNRKPGPGARSAQRPFLQGFFPLESPMWASLMARFAPTRERECVQHIKPAWRERHGERISMRAAVKLTLRLVVLGSVRRRRRRHELNAVRESEGDRPKRSAANRLASRRV